MTPDDPALQRRFVVAMSGGVDSSVAALLLAREGLEVIGLFMRNGVQVSEEASRRKSCCSASDARDARMVAAHLGLAFQAVDLAGDFEHIVRAFVDDYSAGRTPNPCALCNRDLKFDRLLSLADELGAEGVATGHYARLDHERGRVVLRRGVDADKDQSYQLFCVAEEHLARTRLPLGALAKPAVRALAREAGLRTAAKADSQEICFVPSGDYRELLAERGVELHPGRLLDTAGKVLGEHAGTEHFTIGQRRGHGVGGGTPLYVVEVNPVQGTVVLGTRAEACFGACDVDAVNWIGFDPPASGELRCLVQVRYRSEAVAAGVSLSSKDGGEPCARVVFDEPQPAVAPGQGAAFYLADRLLGGGWIRTAERVETTAPPPR
ncbi:MAG: tRNA 2-thiouridine(34) synthase MnmA [Planctomycetota bacterium]|nr:tRNA 2-thiouridine(34) synthase MnmA [Planctomycetota bacterium]